MLENLFNLIKEHGTDAVINNPAIPNEQNDAVLADATHSVADGLQGVLAGGGLRDLSTAFRARFFDGGAGDRHFRTRRRNGCRQEKHPEDERPDRNRDRLRQRNDVRHTITPYARNHRRSGR